MKLFFIIFTIISSVAMAQENSGRIELCPHPEPFNDGTVLEFFQKGSIGLVNADYKKDIGIALVLFVTISIMVHIFG